MDNFVFVSLYFLDKKDLLDIIFINVHKFCMLVVVISSLLVS